MSNKTLNVVDLDFATAKADLINYLKGNPLYKDYNFEGSSLNILTDLLAYNFTKHVFLTNMQYAEGYLDSAQLDSTIASHAKDLNYLPRSVKSAKATVNCTFYASGESQPYTIQKGQSFSTLVKNESIIFTLPETITVSSANTKFSFSADIYEGVYVKDSYVYVSTEEVPYPSFTLTNKSIDTDSLTVAVYEDNKTTPVSFSFKRSLLGLTADSPVFFLQLDSNGFYEVIFGDGVTSRKPKENSVIVLDYRIASNPPSKVNGASTFVINFDPTGATSELITNGQTEVTVTTINVAAGGASRESLESIKYYAPRYFQVQERGVIPVDYETLLKTQFPEIRAVSVFGGEEWNPPVFGNVIISVAVDGFDTIPDSKAKEYQNFLKKRNVGPIKALFVNPDYTYLAINSLIRYNINITTNTKERIGSLVQNAITNYNTNNLNDFNVTLRYFGLTDAINSADESIISNITDIAIYKQFVPKLGTKENYQFNFAVELVDTLPSQSDTHRSNVQTTLYSTPFFYRGARSFFEDDGQGNVRIVQQQNDNNVLVTNVGTIDYSTGIVMIGGIIISGYWGSGIKIFVLPKDKDVVCQKNSILTINPADVNLTIEQIAI